MGWWTWPSPSPTTVFCRQEEIVLLRDQLREKEHVITDLAKVVAAQECVSTLRFQ